MVTMTDVAKRVGVSIKTVSHVINNGPSVSEEMRKKVMKVVEELNYVPDEAARKLRSYGRERVARRTNNIGCISVIKFNMHGSPFYSEVLEGMDQEIIDQGQHLHFIYTIDQLKSNSSLLVNMVNTENVDGVILIGRLDEVFLEKVKRNIKNIVAIDSYLNESYARLNENVDSIDVDNLKIGYDGVKYLADLGHKRIGFTGALDNLRFKGYRLALGDFGLSYDENIVAGEPWNWTIDVGYKYMNKIIENASQLPTAVIAANDRVAMGAMNAVRSKNLKVPDDISIIGFDDIKESENTSPALTTFKINRKQLGILAVQRLKERIQNPALPSTRTLLPTQLIIRKSCKDLKAE